MRSPDLTPETTHPRRRAAVLAASLTVAAGAVLAGAPAQAAAGVTVDAEGKGAVMDSTYSTTLTVKGSGFQSVKGGHGGVYVWFGTVNGAWKPSSGGKSGLNYVYVPDSEAKDNAGFQKYVAFPGSNTASAANGGTMDKKGNWSTKLVVPGPKFDAVGRNGGTTSVDCRKVTCGVITIGAHGVRNGNNETFTPVRLADLYSDEQQPDQAPAGTAGSATGTAQSPSSAPGSGATVSSGQGVATATGSTKGKPSKALPPALVVDHTAAVAGRALSFQASNLVPGEQFTVVLDNGLAAVGPFAAGADGRAAGVVQLPRETSAGTHELRVFGASVDAAVKFGVQEPEEVAAPEEDDDSVLTPANVFAALAGLVFLGAVAFTLLRARRGNRAQA